MTWMKHAPGELNQTTRAACAPIRNVIYAQHACTQGYMEASGSGRDKADCRPFLSHSVNHWGINGPYWYHYKTALVLLYFICAVYIIL